MANTAYDTARDPMAKIAEEAPDVAEADAAALAAIAQHVTLPRSTTAALADIAHAVNTTGKFLGKAVINTTSGLIVTADDAAAADVWLALDGTTAHTPE